MKLILHIGTEKTGTTAIQQFLQKNRKSLDSQSISIPKCTELPDGNQRWVSTFGYDEEKKQDDFQPINIQEKEKRLEKISTKRD